MYTWHFPNKLIMLIVVHAQYTVRVLSVARRQQFEYFVISSGKTWSATPALYTSFSAASSWLAASKHVNKRFVQTGCVAAPCVILHVVNVCANACGMLQYIAAYCGENDTLHRNALDEI